jgi:predicted PurR-regulated permease PerM
MNHDSPSSSADPFIGNAVEAALRIGAVALLVVWVFSIVKPFIVPVIWGVIIAIALFPVFNKLRRALGGRGGMAATLLTVLLLVLLIAPTVMLTNALIDNSIQLSERISEGALGIPPPSERVAGWPVIGEPIAEFWTLASNNLETALGEIKPQIVAFSKWLVGAAAGAGFGVLQFIFAIVIAGAMMANSSAGERGTRSVATRLAGAQGAGFNKLAESTIRGVATGILGVAMIQAILAGLGFLVVGVPGAGIWAVLVLILSVIQIGPFLVLLPVIIYVFSTADPTVAVLFTIWSIVVGLLDNVLKPLLMGRGIDAPILVIFIGAIGGFLSMGIIGLFVGAVVLVLGYQLFQAWLEEDATSAQRAGVETSTAQGK